jgi:hypothetical protein
MHCLKYPKLKTPNILVTSQNFKKWKKLRSKVIKWDFSSKFGQNWMKKVAFVTNGLIQQLISELRVKLALDLDPNPTFERGLGLQSRAKVRVNYLIIGSSHASKLRKVLELIGG